MSINMQQQGMTLTSVLIAVALTGALATAASKLISNQAKLNKIMELTDQRDMIVRFYSALMHNRLVWRCTLYDPSNSALLTYISGTSSSFNGRVQMRSPDCKFRESVTGRGVAELQTLTAVHGSGDHYRSSTGFFVPNPMFLGESMTEHDTGGWWEMNLTAEAVAKGSVDLILEVKFNEANYKAAHANFNPPDIRDTVEYKVRKGDPNVQGGIKDCGRKAVVAIDDLASGLRGITCSTDPLVDVQSIGPESKGNFLHTLADGSDARVGTAPGTNDRTGIRIANVWPFAIKNITPDGNYELAPVAGAAGILTSHCSSIGTTNIGGNRSYYTLHGMRGGIGSLAYDCTYNLGPTGKQGLPGPLGYEGDRGDRGPDAPPCPP